MLEATPSKLRNCRVRWFSDNRNVARLLQVGSHWQIDILVTVLELEWIPHKENKLADYVSRTVDWDGWKLGPILFASLHNVCGPPHTVCTCRFASHHNTQLPRFNSRFA